ncbi:MAG: polyprenyl synthetase family protein [Euryarchaeota archaeon]|nr:polyprenyl synthetase family protein [Euryarchaeota archaeon]
MTKPTRPETAHLMEIMLDRAQLVNREIDRMLPDIRPLKFYESLKEYLEISKQRVRPSMAVYEPIRHVVEAGGKRIRPTLCLLACEAVGGDYKKALPTAVAIELVHTFTLIHDDVMDEDLVRRGRPTAAAIWGNPIAITAGDGLFAIAFRSIAENAKVPGVRRESVLRLVQMLSDTCLGLSQGQTMDLLLEEEADPQIEQYLEMIRLKTGVLLEFALKSGAIIGGGTEQQVEMIGKFGAPLGMAFQIKDDLLNLTGTEEILGKPRGSDIVRGKKTLMVVHGFHNANRRDANRLRTILDLPDSKCPPKVVEEAIGILKEAGSLEFAERMADDLIKEAKSYLTALPRSEATDALRALQEMADFVIHRDR